jgi:hypothetical protein
VICTPCASKREDCRLLNSFSGLALCRHPTGVCRAIGSEHFGACNARNPAGLAVMLLTGGWRSARSVLPLSQGHESPKFKTKDTRLWSSFIPQPANAYLLRCATTWLPALHVIMPENRHQYTKRATHATYEEVPASASGRVSPRT